VCLQRLETSKRGIQSEIMERSLLFHQMPGHAAQNAFYGKLFDNNRGAWDNMEKKT